LSKTWGLDLSPSHSVDREDNNGPYSPENTRWATKVEQGRNKRNNLILEFHGQSFCVTEWADRLGIRSSIIYDRLKAGWSIKDALTTTPKLT